MAEKTRKTAQEKAQEALDVAERKVTTFTEKRDKAKADLETAIASLEVAERNRDYVKQHPALQPLEVDESPVDDGIVKPPTGDGSLGF